MDRGHVDLVGEGVDVALRFGEVRDPDLIVRKVAASEHALGIFGFSYLDQNFDKIQGAVVDGVEPDFDNIADGSYSISRPLYMYVKKSHVGAVPGLEEFLAEFSSDRAWGDEGYLSEKGLIPMPEEERTQVGKAVKDLTPLQL